MEILFRGIPSRKKDRATLSAFNDSFVYGYACGLNQKPDHIFTVLSEIVPVFSKTITQYTGARDAVGKMIFDGDILEYDYDGEKYLVEVYFNDITCAFCIRDVGYSYGECIDFVKECKIVGNVFENPELLKKPIEGVK